MKKLLGNLFCIFLVCFNLNAQETETEKVKEKKSLPKNILKVNLSALMFKNFSVQYERQTGPKTSFAINAHMMPYAGVPYPNYLRKKLTLPEVDFNKMNLGTMGIAPEFRFYLGEKNPLQGFYIGPFLSFIHYKMNLPVKYGTFLEKTGIFDGKMDAASGGLQLGAQFRLGNSVTLDWWILGPNFGASFGELVFTGPLNAVEQKDIYDQIDQIRHDIALDIINSFEVRSTGASVRLKGPIGGIRCLGFNLGIRF